MKKSKALHFTLVALALPAIGLATAGPAAADGPVDWKNRSAGKCLTYDGHTMTAKLGACGRKNWYDVMQSDGTYAEMERGSSGTRCLTADANGRVYSSNCNHNHNRHQRWSEEKSAGGWVLKNAGSGKCLAVDSGAVRAVTCKASNKWQFWK
jgi:hypothetical protein